jgi:hypothetical protein
MRTAQLCVEALRHSKPKILKFVSYSVVNVNAAAVIEDRNMFGVLSIMLPVLHIKYF